MTLLREAVEKQRNYYIKRLINAGILIESNKRIEDYTLSQLKSIYKQIRKEL